SALEQLQLEREQLERQCQQLGVQTAQEYAERQQKVAAELEQLRKDKLAALDLREQELSQREINTEKRFRFHEQHLERLRQSLQAAQSEHEQQRQQDRLWALQVEETIRLRLAHMQRFRDLLSQRETLLEKEQERFATVRREAEQELLDARATRISALADLQIANYSLLSAMGLLTAEYLGLGIPTYDPEAYYNAVKNAPTTSVQGKSLDRVLQAIGKN
ncbi:MAG: hypothetical protein ACK4NE_01795, partial [Albidovulum sp.]